MRTPRFHFSRLGYTGFMRTIALAVQLASFLNIVGLPSANADWPQFLGPDRTGVSKDTTSLVDAFPATGPKIVWKSPGGVGMSGIAVADGKCYSLANRKDQQVLFALDRNTGKEQWSTPLAPAYKNQMGDGPRATPTVDGQRIFTLTGEGILSCNDAQSGKVLWQNNWPKELGTEPSEYGMSSSPLVVGEFIITHAGAETAAVLAVDKSSGKVAWKAGTGRAGYSSPVALSLAGKQQIVVMTGKLCMGLELKTGQVLWDYPFATDYDCNTASPVAIDGKVFISSGENHGSVLLEVTPGEGRWSVKEVWSSLGTGSALRSEWQTPLVSGKLLFGFDNVGGAGPITNLACLDASSGKVLWKQMRFGKSNGILVDGKLAITTLEGELVLVRASGTAFEQLAKAPMLGKTRQAPSYSAGFIFLRDDANVVCVDLRK
jgi:outer membrane protein assembly factor BamB